MLDFFSRHHVKVNNGFNPSITRSAFLSLSKMDDSMPGMGGGDGSAPLNASGVDFSNETQAMDFLGAILDDAVFQIDGNTYARYFWYGMVVFIGLAGISNAMWRATLQMRYVP